MSAAGTAGAAALLEVAALSVGFGGVRAVDDVSFAVAQGTVHGLIGPNGAGKTTAFNLISGLYTPDAGTVKIDGRELTGRPTWERARLGLARTFQNLRLFPGLTVLETVMAGAHLKIHEGAAGTLLRLPGFKAAERAARDEALAILETVGLKAFAGRRAGELSYGDQRRLEIARALAAHPRLLMLDEPAAGMTPSEKGVLAGLIRKLKEQHLTVLAVEHDMGFIMGLCDTISVLNFGRKIAEGTPAAVRADPSVIEAYLGASAAGANA